MEILISIAVATIVTILFTVAGFEMFLKILKGRGFFSSKEDYTKMIEVNTK